MRRIGTIALGFAFLLALGAASEDPGEPQHAYIGAQKCKMCHNSKAIGEQFNKWLATGHAKAYETLATEEAKELAATKGVGDPQKAPECLRCHVTGYDAPPEMLTDKYTVTDGVGCESCHGPGGDYWKLKIMKNKEEAIAAGLVIPSGEFCVTCHNEESQATEPFEFEKMMAKIAHPIPSRAGGK